MIIDPYKYAAAGGGCTSTIYEQLFNSLTDGDLNGQDSWSASAAYDVETSVKYEGAKAVQNAHDGTSGTATRIFTGASAGSMYVAVRKTTNTGTDTSYVMLGSIDGVLVYIRIHTTGNIEYYEGGVGYQTLAAYNANQWYVLHIEWDAAGHTDQYRVRVYDGSSWSAFSAWVATYQSFTEVDRIMFDIDGSGGTVSYWDTVSDCNPVP